MPKMPDTLENPERQQKHRRRSLAVPGIEIGFWRKKCRNSRSIRRDTFFDGMRKPIPKILEVVKLYSLGLTKDAIIYQTELNQSTIDRIIERCRYVICCYMEALYNEKTLGNHNKSNYRNPLSHFPMSYLPSPCNFL